MQQDSVRFSVVAGGGAMEAPLLGSSTPWWLTQRNLCDQVLSFADRNRWLLWLTMLVFYLAAFNGQWRIQPDAALYLSIGRNLAHGLGFTYLGQPERLAHPGWPAIIAFTFKAFGARSLVPVNAVILVISLLTVMAVYRLVLIHSGRPTAVVVSLGTGLTKAFFCYAFELWSDMPFALGVMCALAGFEGICVHQDGGRERRRSQLQLTIDSSLLIFGLVTAAMMRPTIWPLLLAMLLASICRAIASRSLAWALPGIVAAAVAIAGLVIMASRTHTTDAGFGAEYGEFLLSRLSGHANSPVTHSLLRNVYDLFTWAASDVLFQTRLGPVVNALLSLLVLMLGAGLFQYRLLWGLWFWMLLPTILLSQETLDRYFLPVLPLLIFAWWDLLVQANKRLPRQWGSLAFVAMITFGGLMNVTKVCGIIVQQHEHPFLARYNQGIYDGTPEFADRLHEAVGDKAVVLVKAPYGRVTAYLSERFATGAMGTSVDSLKGRRVFVVEPSDHEIQDLLKSAGLMEGPALFAVNPSPTHGPAATSLSLHATHPKSVTNRP